MTRFFLAALILKFSLFVKAQNEDVINYFSATEFNGKVLLAWEIEQGNTCNGIQILRSEDSINFQQIGSIEGICGSTQSVISYDFTDLFPIKNETNYYRLSLGGVGFSWIINVQVIDVGKNNYRIQPNPLSSCSKLFFNNDSALEYSLTVSNLEGKVVYTDNTIKEEYILSKDSFSKGMYRFTISSELLDTKIEGEFAVFD